MVHFAYQAICSLLLLAAYSHGSCFIGLLTTSPPDDSSDGQDPAGYCEYEGVQYAIGAKWNPVSPACFSCECRTYGFQCCGYGRAAGAIAPPENCQLAEDTCDIVFVQTSDPSQACGADAVTTTISTTAARSARPKKTTKKHKKRL